MGRTWQIKLSKNFETFETFASARVTSRFSSRVTRTWWQQVENMFIFMKIIHKIVWQWQ